ncbi:MAG: family 10 glycosylhydrolase [Bacteroidales bacterium]|nr:family 10 glycosylhydrolase [Candidatus Cryptobacteroides aphodequi]
MKILVLIASMLAAMTACGGTDPVTPTPGPEPGPDPVVKEGRPRYVWIDAAANFNTFANNKNNIADELAQLAEIGFTDIIVDVRPTEGCVLYNTKLSNVPRATRLAAWVGSQYKFVERKATWDYLQAFIDLGHDAGLRVNASINTFVAGYGGMYGLASVGPIFSGDIPASWASKVNNAGGIQSSFSDDVQGTVFLNPANDDAQSYVLEIIHELAGYNLDGIILDRCRFDDEGLGSDFSDETKAKFATYLGTAPSKWPVFDAGLRDLPSVLTAEQKSWMSFRAKVIHDFVEKASQTVHAVNPKMRFGCYVGAWYSSYYSSGVNWASPRYNTHAKYPKWANEDYQNYGYADHCDFMMLGCYAAASSVYGSGEWTMQGFCNQGKSLLMGDTVFAGGPDIGNPTGWTDGKQSATIPKTIDACIKSADGYFVFDLCHIRMYNYWDAFKQGFDNYINSL